MDTNRDRDAATIKPLPASLLLDQELARRELHSANGNLTTGCSELDGYLLLGGFERGSVVGVSAEEEEMGLLLGLQTLAQLLVTRRAARVMVVTTLSVDGLVRRLREVLVGELAVVRGLVEVKSEVRGCLERIAIARVFDVEGLWEVLGELEGGGYGGEETPWQEAELTAGDAFPLKEPTKSQKQQRTEIMDSEDEEELSSPEPSSPSPPPAAPHNPVLNTEDTQPSRLPDMILITHTSTLLNTLFTGRDKESAHNTMLLLSSRLHSLTRSHGGPLIVFLNSTASPSSAHHADGDASSAADRRRPPKQFEQTLYSIFNPPPPPPAASDRQEPGHSFASAMSMRNRPSFGLVFAQMLDLHLLCTLVPRTKTDRVALMASGGTASVGYLWVVEVLLDEVGVYGLSEEGEWERRCREQRWAVVDVDGAGRVVNAFS